MICLFVLFNLILGYIVIVNENQKSVTVLFDNGMTDKIVVAPDTIKHFIPFKNQDHLIVCIDGVETNAWLLDIDDNGLLDVVVFNSNESSLRYGVSQCHVKRPVIILPYIINPYLIQKYTLEKIERNKAKEINDAKLKKPIEEIIHVGMVVEALFDKDGN